ncbi:hypothetical protein [Halorhabdus rudnickae]|uniref:hypothetical protein n=1 Tax=Halorhabdus rudnickae TaxID=1775544 RepID=UPI0014383DB3|nr:hypothetical protein [Halorhabdus rudnickae]
MSAVPVAAVQQQVTEMDLDTTADLPAAVLACETWAAFGTCWNRHSPFLGMASHSLLL